MQIEWNNLSRGQKVWYTYSGLAHAKPNGPFKILGVYGSHDGRHVALVEKDKSTRDVRLTDDEDYGEPVFFDNPEGT